MRRRGLLLAVLVVAILALSAFAGELGFDPITEGGPKWDF